MGVKERGSEGGGEGRSCGIDKDRAWCSNDLQPLHDLFFFLKKSGTLYHRTFILFFSLRAQQ